MEKDKNWMPDYTGPFKDVIPEYIGFKRSQGYSMRAPECYKLRELDNFAKEHCVAGVEISRELYDGFTMPKEGEKPGNSGRRISVIKAFSKYLVSMGYDHIYTGYDDTRIFKTDFIPHIFSDDETSRVFECINELCMTDPSLKNASFRIMMLMYRCCGFRRSEVQNLNMKDVDVATGKVTVLDGKNNVSRIVPVSDSLRIELECYKKVYRNGTGENEPFCCFTEGRRVGNSSLYALYHNVLDSANVQRKADGSRPRLHDWRHTFCVRALEQMESKGFDLYASLPLLSTYLGHKHITETEYYLRMMDEHFSGILKKSSDYSGGVFPHIERGDEDNGH